MGFAMGMAISTMKRRLDDSLRMLNSNELKEKGYYTVVPVNLIDEFRKAGFQPIEIGGDPYTEKKVEKNERKIYKKQIMKVIKETVMFFRGYEKYKLLEEMEKKYGVDLDSLIPVK